MTTQSEIESKDLLKIAAAKMFIRSHGVLNFAMRDAEGNAYEKLLFGMERLAYGDSLAIKAPSDPNDPSLDYATIDIGYEGMCEDWDRYLDAMLNSKPGDSIRESFKVFNKSDADLVA
ncbi:MAG: hypothetical protein GC165_01085 [Armatimonadetes bacterium]|nr:hypothetical protein [Armatimonadota bacterium]